MKGNNTMFNIVRKNGSAVKAACQTREMAEEYLQNMGPQRNFYRIEEVSNPVVKQETPDAPLQVVDTGSPSQQEVLADDTLFEGAVRITRQNVKFFYKKEGLIRVLSPNGKILHTGKTRNMGKVFSNYVNCARYNQSYDFNIEGGDVLLFKETTL
jgi:hypothetical protein